MNNNIIVELFSMDFPRYNPCITSGNYYDTINNIHSNCDEYLLVRGIPHNFKCGDLIKYPSKDTMGKAEIGYIAYMNQVYKESGTYIIGIFKMNCELDGAVHWVNKFKKFILED